ncbi:MAG: PAS domain S-box protein [Syntrophales bacterium]|jgi:PAS domain S-box-containing protein
MKEPKHIYKDETRSEKRENLYRRHFQGALINSAGCVIMWIFVFCAFYVNAIKMNQFVGVTLGLTYLILINPPTLWILKRINSVRLQKYFSILIEFLMILGFTVNIYFLGGMEVAYLTLIYAGLIMYVGIVGPQKLPFIIAILCSAIFSLVIVAEHFGFIPHQGVFNSFDMPWLTQLLSLSTIITLLIIVAYISSYTAGVLKKNRDKLREQNLDLMEKAATLAAAEQQLRTAHQDLEIRIKERTAELARANEDLESELTARKQVEDALRESEEKLKNILEAVQAGIVVIDPETHRIVDVNPLAARMINAPRDRIIGSVCHNYICPVEVGKCPISDLDQTIDNAERVLLSADGRKYSIIKTVVTVKIEGREHLLESFIDITERKRAEEALRQSEEKYRTIIENMEEGYIEVDIEGRLTFFNKAARKFLGYSKDETMGMHYKKYADEETAQNILRAYRNVYKTGVPLPLFEWEVIRKDGTRRTVEGSASLIADAEERPVGFRGLFRDTTDRKRLQRAEKMEALGTMAGGVAHDLNNVLGIVVGYAEMLLMNTDESSPIREDLLTIMSGGQRAAAIVQDLLTLTRRGVSRRTVLNLNRIIADSQQSPEFKNLSSYHPSVKIRTDLEPDLLNISGSFVHLGKTVFNLVSNASEAMPNGGIVTIKTANQYLDKPIQGYDDIREGDYVVLSVSDTGEGIAASDLKRIFEPFYTKKVMGRSGTGLGLAVVWGTVKDHNGYIDVQSEEGKGSTFTLYFPVTREDITAEAASISISEYMGKGESILIVDDVKGQRDLAAGMLKKLNYNVSSVSSGEEAIAYLKEQKIDLIVLDMIMDPGMDGLDTYRSILEIHPKQKAVIVSGFSESDRVHAAQTLGAGAYVRKPYVIEKLGLAVREELDRK